MMDVPASTAVRRRLLAAELRRLRESKSIRGDEVAYHLGWSVSKVSRLELVRLAPRLSQITQLLDYYRDRGVLTGKRRAELLALAEARPPRSWMDAYAHLLPAASLEFAGLAEGATQIMEWQQDAIPALLRTEEYSRHMHGAQIMPPTVAAAWADLDTGRQAILDRDDPPALSVVLDEAVLTRQVGDRAVMLGQMQRLARASYRPYLTLRVLPSGTPHPIFGGSFTLLRFGDSAAPVIPDVVGHDHLQGMCTEDDGGQTFPYWLAFTALTTAAGGPEAARQLIAAAAARYEDS